MVMCHRHISCSADIVLGKGMNKTGIHKWLAAAHRFRNADDHCKAFLCFGMSMLILYANTSHVQHHGFVCAHCKRQPFPLS